jgi:hypothetical protein
MVSRDDAVDDTDSDDGAHDLIMRLYDYVDAIG